jgi:hypothetical protein
MRNFLMPPKALLSILLLPFAGIGTGCTGVLHQVTVDAINDPTAPVAFAYSLEPMRPALLRDARIHAFAVACIQEALAARGLYRQATGERPDVIIEYDYGIGESIPLTNSAPMMEKYLVLSARPPSATQGTRADEVWNVRISVHEAGAGIDRALPLLATVAIDYAGTDSVTEQIIAIPDRSPAIVQVRNAGTAAMEGAR